MIDEKKLLEKLEELKFANEERGYDTAKDVVQEIINLVNEQPSIKYPYIADKDLVIEGADEEFLQECKEVAKKYEKQPQADKWIPCEERLPEPSKRYLVSVVWVDGDYVSKPTVYDAVFGTDGKWHTDDYKEVPYEVLAWQPLPQPYKKEGENDG